jgi:hypothetical protein
MADLLTIDGRGTIGTDGKPTVNLVFEVNCDAAIELAGESVFQSPIIRERVDSLNNVICHLQQQNVQLLTNENNYLFEINRLKNELVLKKAQCSELQNVIKTLAASNKKLQKDLIVVAARANSN